MRTLLLGLFAIILAINTPQVVVAAPVALGNEYSIEVMTEKIDSDSWTFSYNITNNNQQIGTSMTGFDAFSIQLPVSAVISNVKVPLPYNGSPGYWDYRVSPENILSWWGFHQPSVYPIGSTATLSFQADGVKIGSVDSIVTTFWALSIPPYPYWTSPSGANYTDFSTKVVGPVAPCTLPVGHLDYCLECGPCAEGEGDCDNDGECQSGLTCAQVAGTDYCQQPPNCKLPVGHLDYCRDCGPCIEGEGDCDNNDECLGDLTCPQVPGTDTCQGICDVPVGHLDYCRDCGPCPEGEGDCDDDSECQSGLTCFQVSGVDTCQNGGFPVGHLDYCRDVGPCAAGEGDCDSDSECQSGLTCVQVTGTDVCCPHPLGHLDYCYDCGPCAAGQGDCDNDSECAGDLTCPQVPGTDTCN